MYSNQKQTAKEYIKISRVMNVLAEEEISK